VRRKKFRKISGLPPNFKPKTKKAITTAKRLWDRYAICACGLCLRGVTEHTADGVLLGIVSILVSIPIHIFWKASITTLNPGLIGSTVQPRRRRTIVLVYTGSGCANDYADSHKNKRWQPYAAGTAAAYAKELLLVIPAVDTAKTQTAGEAVNEALSRGTDTILGQGTMLEPSTPHIGKGVALVAQAAAPVYPRVYRRPTISDSRNDHSSFYATGSLPR
jgi:hypothetical protein